MREFWKHPEWLAFRERVLESDGYRCRACDRPASPKVILQVHHKKYVDGRKPWEYSPAEVESLCRGCHGSRHRFWPPLAGWEEVGEDDLGSPDGECELCGNSIRYVHELWHPDWGYLDVGVGCDDTLTALEGLSEQQLLERRASRFVKSARWKQQDNAAMMEYYGIEIQISQRMGTFHIGMNDATSIRKWYPTLDHAKTEAFAAIHTGRVTEWLLKKRNTTTQASQC